MPNDNQNKNNTFPQDDGSLGMSTVSGDTQAASPTFNSAQGSSSPSTDLPNDPMSTTSPAGPVSPPPADSSILNPQPPNPLPVSPVMGTTVPTSTNVVTDNPQATVSGDSTHVPKKYGGKKVIATIFSVLFIVGAVFAGVKLVQQQQLLEQEAASGSACEQSPDCDLVDNAPNSGTRTVARTIIYVDITDQDYHRYNPGSTDDGCRRVNISGNTVTWERYGTGSDCKDVSNVQIWMGNLPSSTPTASPSPATSPTPTLTSTPTPTRPPNSTPTPTKTVSLTPTLPPDVVARCNSVKAYNLSGVELTQAQLAQLKTGDKVRFAVSGQATSGSFSKARFSVNNVLVGESTTQNTQGEYYIEYTIPQSTTNFSVKGEVFHSSLGWI